MRAAPILFSGPMVRALLDGRKTQTRRIVGKGNSHGGSLPFGKLDFAKAFATTSFSGTGILKAPPLVEDDDSLHRIWPCWQIGDLLWVRESLQRFDRDPPTAQYAATLVGVPAPAGVARHACGAALWPWQRKMLPSILMPRWASRLTLRVTSIRVQRLHDITEGDALAEGVRALAPGERATPIPNVTHLMGSTFACSARDAFMGFWVELNGMDSFKCNAWVWAVSFEVHKQNIDAYLAQQRGGPKPGTTIEQARYGSSAMSQQARLQAAAEFSSDCG